MPDRELEDVAVVKIGEARVPVVLRREISAHVGPRQKPVGMADRQRRVEDERHVGVLLGQRSAAVDQEERADEDVLLCVRQLEARAADLPHQL
jgi:hypothetical protein